MATNQATPLFPTIDMSKLTDLVPLDREEDGHFVINQSREGLTEIVEFRYLYKGKPSIVGWLKSTPYWLILVSLNNDLKSISEVVTIDTHLHEWGNSHKVDFSDQNFPYGLTNAFILSNNLDWEQKHNYGCTSAFVIDDLCIYKTNKEIKIVIIGSISKELTICRNLNDLPTMTETEKVIVEDLRNKNNLDLQEVANLFNSYRKLRFNTD